MNSIVELLGVGLQGWGRSLLMATVTTLLVTIAALLIGAVIGTLVAACRISSIWLLNRVGEIYTVIFRSIPELLIIYLLFFGSSAALTGVAGWFGGGSYIQLPPFWVGALAVGLISAAYQAEVYRGAFNAVANGELEAGWALGMSRWTVLQRIVGPRVFQISLPGLGNVWQMSLKDSALISVTGLVELMRASQVAAGSTYQYLLFYLAAGVGYIILTGLSNVVFLGLERFAGSHHQPTGSGV